MDATPENTGSDDTPRHSEEERFQRLIERSWGAPDLPQPARDVSHLRHGQPFMGRAVFDFGRREPPPEAAPAASERVPCPLCGEPSRLRHAYCQRCGFRLPWATEVEGLPEAEPRRNRLDHAVERAISDTEGARCRFCAAQIAAYDRRCRSCGRWLSSNWNRAALDAWQPDFDAWNFSQVRGFGGGCLSPIALAVAVILWRVLS